MHGAIPEDIQNFILTNIDSIAQLEGLLLFHADPGLEGRAALIARRLYITGEEAAALLDHLARRGFLEKEGKGEAAVYSYRPGPDNLHTIARLAETYARCLVPVTYLVHSKRKSKIQEFADAFWIRKE